MWWWKTYLEGDEGLDWRDVDDLGADDSQLQADVLHVEVLEHVGLKHKEDVVKSPPDSLRPATETRHFTAPLLLLLLLLTVVNTLTIAPQPERTYSQPPKSSFSRSYTFYHLLDLK